MRCNEVLIKCQPSLMPVFYYSKLHRYETYQSHVGYYFDQITIISLKFLVILILPPNVLKFRFIELFRFELRWMHFTP